MEKGYLFIGFAIICLIITATTLLTTEPLRVEVVDCYDEHHNKINGLTCDNLIYPNSYYWISGLSIIGMLLFLMYALYTTTQ